MAQYDFARNFQPSAQRRIKSVPLLVVLIGFTVGGLGYIYLLVTSRVEIWIVFAASLVYVASICVQWYSYHGWIKAAKLGKDSFFVWKVGLWERIPITSISDMRVRSFRGGGGVIRLRLKESRLFRTKRFFVYPHAGYGETAARLLELKAEFDRYKKALLTLEMGEGPGKE